MEILVVVVCYHLEGMTGLLIGVYFFSDDDFSFLEDLECLDALFSDFSDLSLLLDLVELFLLEASLSGFLVGLPFEDLSELDFLSESSDLSDFVLDFLSESSDFLSESSDLSDLSDSFVLGDLAFVELFDALDCDFSLFDFAELTLDFLSESSDFLSESSDFLSESSDFSDFLSESSDLSDLSDLSDFLEELFPSDLAEDLTELFF